MTAGRVRLMITIGVVGVLEAMCRLGTIDRFAMPPPSEIKWNLGRILVTGQMWPAIAKTFANVAAAGAAAIVAGVALGTLIHRWVALRETLDPAFAAYYAIPIYAFYPLFIVVFGLGDLPQVLIGFMLALVAVIVNTLNGLDRVPRVLLKTARIQRLGRVSTALKVSLPFAAPYVFTGIKLAVAYSFIGVIGSEFILSSGGLGYRISFSYNNFQSDVMYGLILFVLLVVICINMGLYAWERSLMERRGGR